MSSSGSVDEFDNLHDQLALETDRRKIQKLLDDGTIRPEDLEGASVVELQPTCHCNRGIAFIEGTRPVCPGCGKPAKEVESESD